MAKVDQDNTNTDIVTIKRADNYVDIIDIHGDSFFTSVNKKLMQPLKELFKE